MVHKKHVFRQIMLFSFLFVLLLSDIFAGPNITQNKIHPDLQEKFEKSSEKDIVPVFILFKRQADKKEMERLFSRFSKKVRREKSITRLKGLSGNVYCQYMSWLEKNGLEKKIKTEKNSFWLVNGMMAKATKSIIQKASLWEGISKIYLRTEKPHDFLKQDENWARLSVVKKPSADEFKKPFHFEQKKIAWNVKKIKANEVWSDGYTGKGVTVAILDSGVNYIHPDIRNNLWMNKDEIPENGKDDDCNGYIDDFYGWNFAEENQNIGDRFFHGTESAGIIVGDGSSGIVTGVAPQADLMILKTYAFDQTLKYGSRFLWQAFQYDKWRAFQYALEEGADVASLSFDYQPGEKPLFAPWRFVLSNTAMCGLTIVAGAGNSRGWLHAPNQITPPANIPEVITVGGVNKDLSVNRMSSRGPVTWENIEPFNDFPLPKGLVKPDICAPIGKFPLISYHSDGYNYLSSNAGTSLSGPHAAGAAALILEKNPLLMPSEVKKRLEQTSKNLGHPGKDYYYGRGFLNAEQAVSYASPNIWIKEVISGNKLYLTKDDETNITVICGVSAHPLEEAEAHLYSEEDELKISANEQNLKFRSPIKNGSDFKIEFPVRILDSCRENKKIRLYFSLRVIGGRKFSFEFPVYLGPSNTIVVDDDGHGESEKPVLEALERAQRYHHYIKSQDFQKLESAVTDYQNIIWITGEKFTDTINKKEQTLQKRLMDKGKNFLIIGDNIGDDIGESDFFRNCLHARLVKSRLSSNYGRDPYFIHGKKDNPVTRRMIISVSPYHRQYDFIRPADKAESAFTGKDRENYPGFVQYEGQYKVFYFSVGMEAIENIDARAKLIDHILEWFTQ